LRARRARVLLALLAVTLGTGVATALGTLALQVGDDLARTLRAAGPNFVLRPEGADWRPEPGLEATVSRVGAGLPERALASTRSTFWRNNVLEAAPELDLRLRARGRVLEATGTWFDREVPTEDGPWRTGLGRLRPLWRVRGAWPRGSADELALGSELAASLGASPGDSITVAGPAGARTLRVTGVVTTGGLESRRVWLPLEPAQALAGRPGEVDRVSLSALVTPAPRTAVPDPDRDPTGYERWMCTAYPDNVARDLAAAVPGSEVLPLTEVVAGEAGVVSRLHLLMLLLALAAITASALGLLSTTTATVLERSREFGLMRALGATSAQLATLLLAETLVVSLVGGALGWLTGTGAALLIRGEAFAGPAAAQPLLLPVALAVAAAVAFAGTLGPLRLALRMDPVEVLRG